MKLEQSRCNNIFRTFRQIFNLFLKFMKMNLSKTICQLFVTNSNVNELLSLVIEQKVTKETSTPNQF